jgi:hypothetical protein
MRRQASLIPCTARDTPASLQTARRPELDVHKKNLD